MDSADRGPEAALQTQVDRKEKVAESCCAQKTYRKKRNERLKTLEAYVSTLKNIDEDRVAASPQQHHDSSVLLPLESRATLASHQRVNTEALLDGYLLPHAAQTSSSSKLVEGRGSSLKSFLASASSHRNRNSTETLGRVEDQETHVLPILALVDQVDLAESIRDSCWDSNIRKESIQMGVTSLDLVKSGGLSMVPSASDMANSILPVPFLPDPCRSSIHLRRQTLGDALFHNARAIGLTLEQVMQPDCCSPFYQSSSSSTINYSQTLTISRDAIPPHLQPTPAQKQFLHHPFLDLLPWPWFREQAILLAGTNPSMYDRKQLKKDILTGGIKCWKSRSSVAGEPWNRRSWEAEPWFLKKWGWLVDKDGEVEEQSRWWRSWEEVFEE